MKKPLITAALAASLMIGALFSAEAMRPTLKLAELRPPLELEALIPERFGDWRIDTLALMPIINPQTEETLERIYAQTLNRVYINEAGDRIMLAVAYGEDQRDSLQAHTPDVCYPAQGFRIEGGREAELDTVHGLIPVRQRIAHLSGRWEPLTYWTTVGDEVVRSGFHKKTVELRHGVRREIPDGLLFRVSSLDRNSDRAFAVQGRFIGQLIDAVPVSARSRLAGLRDPA